MSALIQQTQICPHTLTYGHVLTHITPTVVIRSKTASWEVCYFLSDVVSGFFLLQTLCWSVDVIMLSFSLHYTEFEFEQKTDHS